MKYFVLLLAPVAAAFVARPEARLRPAFSWQLTATRATNTPVPSPLGYDKARAVECAETFGKCSLKEVKEIRDCKYQHFGLLKQPILTRIGIFPAIHDARVKTMLTSNLAGGNAHVEDTLLQQRILEEELSLQLNLLQDEMPETKANVLFPIEATMHPEHLLAPDPATAAQSLTWMDENLSDAVAICVVIGLLAFAPNLLH